MSTSWTQVEKKYKRPLGSAGEDVEGFLCCGQKTCRRPLDFPQPLEKCRFHHAFLKGHGKTASRKNSRLWHHETSDWDTNLPTASKINACNTSKFILKYQCIAESNQCQAIGFCKTIICSLPLEVFSLPVLVWGVRGSFYSSQQITLPLVVSLQSNIQSYVSLQKHYIPSWNSYMYMSSRICSIRTHHPKSSKNWSQHLLVSRCHDACIVHKASIYQL